jgi:PAS domain S-box-containing protein
MKKPLSDILFLLATSFLALIVFTFEVNSKPGSAFAPLYTLVILFSWILPRASTLFCTALCTILIFVSAGIHIQNNVDIANVIINAFSGLVSLLVTFILIQIARNSVIELEQINSKLHDTVEKKTYQLKERLKELSDYQLLLEESKRVLKNLHFELQKSEHRYQMMINNLNDYSIVFVKTNGKIHSWNNGAKNLRGYDASDVKDMLFYELILQPGDDLHERGSDIIKRFEHQEIYEHISEQFKKDGTRWYAHDTVVKVYSNEKEFLGFSWITHDLSDLKKKEEEIENLNKDLEQKVIRRTKDLESFAYSVSHDLRAPLRAIKGFSEILSSEYREKVKEEDFHRFLDFIQQNAQKMSVLIDDLLTFSRVGKKSLDLTQVNLLEMMNDIFGDLCQQYPEYKKTTVHIDVNLPIIRGDRTLLQQAITNLLSNALKYSANKEIPTVNVTYEALAHSHLISIKDNGAGFDNKYTNKLFKIFQRLHDGNEFEGTGIGLAIVKQVAKAHNGKVTASGILGEGATFTLEIPTNL